MRYHFTLMRTQILEKIVATNIGKDVGDKGRFYAADGNVNWFNPRGKQTSQNRNESTLGVSNFSPRDLPKEKHVSKKYMW